MDIGQHAKSIFKVDDGDDVGRGKGIRWSLRYDCVAVHDPESMALGPTPVGFKTPGAAQLRRKEASSASITIGADQPMF